MKRFGQFIIVFLIVMIVGYLQPVFFANQENPSVQNAPVEKKSHKSISYSKIKAQGLAAYVGSSSQALLNDFGEPTRKFSSALGYDWWLYSYGEDFIFQAAVREDQVTSIFQLGNLQESSASSIEIGMDLKSVTKISPISSDFSITYQENTTIFELSESEMRKLPLIAFDNDTFAILYMNNPSNKVMGIRYVDIRTLLELLPYHVVEGNTLAVTLQEMKDWGISNQENDELFLLLSHTLRKNQKNVTLKETTTDRAFFEEKINQFVREPEKIIKNVDALQTWQIHMEDSYFSSAIHFNDNDKKRFLKDYEKKNELIFADFLSPAIDIPWAVMETYAKIENSIEKEDDLSLLVVYQQDHLFYGLLKEAEAPQETSTSESSLE